MTPPTWLEAHGRRRPNQACRTCGREVKIHVGHFLIDQAGIVRWVHIETPIDDVSRYGQFPTDKELIAAARECLSAH